MRQLGVRAGAANADSGSYGVHRVLQRAIALPFDRGRLHAHDIRERCDTVAAQIDHTSPGGVPQRRRIPFHVSMERERHEAPMRRAKIQRRRRAPRGSNVGILAGLQTLVPWMRSGVLLGQTGNQRIPIHEHRIAGLEVATVDVLPHQISALERLVIVHHVDLEKAAVHACEIQRRPPPLHAAPAAGDPVR